MESRLSELTPPSTNGGIAEGRSRRAGGWLVRGSQGSHQRSARDRGGTIGGPGTAIKYHRRTGYHLVTAFGPGQLGFLSR